MLGQKLLYMSPYHYGGGCQVRPLTQRKGVLMRDGVVRNASGAAWGRSWFWAADTCQEGRGPPKTSENTGARAEDGFGLGDAGRQQGAVLM